MARFMRFRFVFAVALCASLVGGSAVRAQNPTLGELAKKEEERRRALKTAGKVVTNDDLPKSTAKPQPPTPDKPAAAVAEDKTPKPAEDAGKPKSEEGTRDQAYWKERIGQVREELRRNEMFAEALQTRINALTADFTARDDPHQRARVAEDRVKALAELDRLKADMELQKKKISDIEEDARRQGAPPGWLR